MLKGLIIKGDKRKGIPDDFNFNKDNYKLPFEDNELIVFYCHNYLHRVKNINLFLNEAWRALKQEGFLDIVVPLAPARNAFDHPETARYFTTATWEILIDKNKWKILNLDHNSKIIETDMYIQENFLQEFHIKLRPIKEEK
ncbi:MAG: methyltransferase domain-containing protein [Sulfurovaceae bacterium]|nr:methyltransferase domain-containing protein [Sulfurovaceae bacterium]